MKTTAAPIQEHEFDAWCRNPEGMSVIDRSRLINWACDNWRKIVQPDEGRLLEKHCVNTHDAPVEALEDMVRQSLGSDIDMPEDLIAKYHGWIYAKAVESARRIIAKAKGAHAQ